MGFWHDLFHPAEDEFDGCDLVLSGDWEPVEDRDIALLVLFASRLDGDAIRRLREYREAHGE
jgi:hypothetical protein